mgnify:CR=1 FL=1
MDSSLPERKFDYRGMVITIELTGDGDQISAHADVHRHGQFAGRVALTASQAERQIFSTSSIARRKSSPTDSWPPANWLGPAPPDASCFCGIDFELSD